MFAIAVALIATGTLTNQLSNTVSKQPRTLNEQSPFVVGFLSLFWGVLFFIIIQLFGADFTFNPDSIPTVSLRLALEIILSYLAIQGMLKAQLSTTSMVRLLTIPGLLVVDILLGYSISPNQITGIVLLFIALVVFTHNDKMTKNGVGWLAGGALLAIATTSLFKYNTTHYNSIAAEQTIILVGLLVCFAILSIAHHTHPFAELKSVWGEKVAVLNGLSTLILSFAFGLLPASLFITLKRSGSLIWSTILGAHVFHDQHLIQKITALAFAICGITLLAL